MVKYFPVTLSLARQSPPSHPIATRRSPANVPIYSVSILAIKVIHLALGWRTPPAGPIKSCGDVGSTELHRQNLLPGTSINILTQRAIFHPGVRPSPAIETRQSGSNTPYLSRRSTTPPEPRHCCVASAGGRVRFSGLCKKTSSSVFF
ncbi:hypothetical protein E2C01_090614 [Portunus trituberculatus]|uniref:Uncharacterized protein n=1 Tax=Portunus trituberculatus TaxID=210409 RepID=A0A5B7JSW1_PORTR|nr:hypothetical protein [Portunus trituberculatus]